MALCLRKLFDSGTLDGPIIYTCDNQKLRDEDFPKEMEKWGCGDILPYIERRCYAGAYTITGKHYGLWLGDEIDYMITPEYIKFAQNNTFQYKVLMTGTCNKEKRPQLDEIAPIIYEKKTWELEAAGVLNKTRYFKVPYLLNDNENKTYHQYLRRFSSAYEKYEGEELTGRIKDIAKQRKQFLSVLETSYLTTRKLISEIYWAQIRLLVFCQSTAMADLTLPYTYHTGSDKAGWLQKFDDGEIPAIAVVGKINRGTNLNGVNCIIYQAPTASGSRFQQQNGRGKRLHADEFLYSFFLIPYFRENIGTPQRPEIIVKPTVVEKWVNQSLEDVDKSFLQTFQFKAANENREYYR